MHVDDCYQLGYIIRPHGLRGELQIFIDTDNPQAYQNLESVFVLEGQQLVPFFIDQLQVKQKGLAVVKFEGVDSEDDARQLLKAALYLPIEALPPLQGNQFYFHEVIGFKLIDKAHGEVGIIQAINDEAAQPLMFVQAGDREVIIPIVDPIIQKLDRQNKALHIQAPEGLIEFYLAENGEFSVQAIRS